MFSPALLLEFLLHEKVLLGYVFSLLVVNDSGFIEDFLSYGNKVKEGPWDTHV
jgi:hypothetical protein